MSVPEQSDPSRNVSPPTLKIAASAPKVGGPDGPDPLVMLLIEETRRSNDALRKELVASMKAVGSEIRDMRSDMSDELRELRNQAPGKLSFYLSASIVTIALVCVLGMMATRGIDVPAVASAASELVPAAPLYP